MRSTGTVTTGIGRTGREQVNPAITLAIDVLWKQFTLARHDPTER